jgi:hypothetical protein
VRFRLGMEDVEHDRAGGWAPGDGVASAGDAQTPPGLGRQAEHQYQDSGPRARQHPPLPLATARGARSQSRPPCRRRRAAAKVTSEH